MRARYLGPWLKANIRHKLCAVRSDALVHISSRATSFLNRFTSHRRGIRLMRRHGQLCADGGHVELLLQRGLSMESVRRRRGTPITRRLATTNLLHIKTSCGARSTKVREPQRTSTGGTFVRTPTCHHVLLCRHRRLRVADALFSSAWRLPVVSDITADLVFLPPCRLSRFRLCGSCSLGRQLGFVPCLSKLAATSIGILVWL